MFLFYLQYWSTYLLEPVIPARFKLLGINFPILVKRSCNTHYTLIQSSSRTISDWASRFISLMRTSKHGKYMQFRTLSPSRSLMVPFRSSSVSWYGIPLSVNRCPSKSLNSVSSKKPSLQVQVPYKFYSHIHEWWVTIHVSDGHPCLLSPTVGTSLVITLPGTYKETLRAGIKCEHVQHSIGEALKRFSHWKKLFVCILLNAIFASQSPKTL